MNFFIWEKNHHKKEERSITYTKSKNIKTLDDTNAQSFINNLWSVDVTK